MQFVFFTLVHVCLLFDVTAHSLSVVPRVACSTYRKTTCNVFRTLYDLKVIFSSILTRKSRFWYTVTFYYLFKIRTPYDRKIYGL